ncbi:hypothetical protein [Caballeronia hypogeia]|uniref:hypothetical protein n=1 Tax=Caballeronia hypogeia TaxID=1777140 RepID=UPI0007727763|nr:hypothetical protein [Caballeronia hypogeia]
MQATAARRTRRKHAALAERCGSGRVQDEPPCFVVHFFSHVRTAFFAFIERRAILSGRGDEIVELARTNLR